MNFGLRSLMYSGVSLAALAVGSAPAGAASCSSLAAVPLPDTTISLAQSYSAGQVITTRATAPVDLCRVVGKITPSSDSNINFEVWLPSTGWTGRYEQVGNGGFAGSIVYSALVPAVANFNATASTDDGSSLLPGQAPGAFGQSRDRLEDYAVRAVHLTNLNAKALIAAFYGKGPTRSYFNGCSKGGGESLAEAERFPNDFDGILGGAAARYGTALISGFMWDTVAVAINNAGFVPAANVAGTLTPVEMAQCAHAKLVPSDLFLNDPRQCHIDFSQVLCTGAPSSTCLTQPQIDGIKAVIAGPRTTFGRKIAPGYEPDFANWVGNAVDNAQTPPAVPNTSQSFFAIGAFGNWITPTVTTATFDVDTSPAELTAQDADILNFNDPDLRPFRSYGGKLIQYHGYADPLVATQFSIDYFNQVVDFNRRHGHGHDRDDNHGHGSDALADTQEFFRLYLAPGMGHCGGGQGPNSFGQNGGLPAGNPASDIFAALEQWVEQGTAPGQIVAAGTNRSVSPAVPFTRPLCPYPQKAVYVGGDTNQASSFACRADRDDDGEHDQDDDHGRD
jgi:hypothetical protein